MLDGERFEVACERARLERFWRRAEKGLWEADLFKFIRRHAAPGSVFLDVGAWIGPASLFASRFADRVIAFEPDPAAADALERNIALNATNIDARRVAIDIRSGSLLLHAADGFGGSETSALTRKGEGLAADTLTLDDLAAEIPDHMAVALKVDVEGHEYQLGRALAAFVKKRQAPLHLSVHPALLDRFNAAQYAPPRARLATFAATRRLLAVLSEAGDVVLASSDAAPGFLDLLWLAGLRPREFSVVVTPRAPH
ncbi:MAG: hypothetical protein BGP06_09100 [Rhizobiales bacterium 65-9]|nr:FkbM family methyltransferase [Hyphomicrobiales bacterium]OJY38622.1 MAG: hypothetical protein BGP06_09100 [Rhizobiales bacterium 65-9]